MNKMCSVILNETNTYMLSNIGFDCLSEEVVNSIYKDGRVFSHFIEKWLEGKYPLKHITGCKGHDFEDRNYPGILYDEKTFTSRGCAFCPSNMLGQGRKFDKEVFEEKTKDMIFCIVSNITFPEIKVRFVSGIELMGRYPNGRIPSKDFVKFFD